MPRAAVAGNAAVKSGLVVNKTLMTSSTSRSLLTRMPVRSSRVAVAISSASLAATVVAPRSARTSIFVMTAS